MPTNSTFATAVMTVVCCLSAPAPAAQSEGAQVPNAAAEASTARSPSAGDKALDALVVRPVTFFTSLFSGAIFIASLPFIPLDSGTDVTTARKALVDYPLGYTFTRPLGDFGGPGAPSDQPSMGP
jgi:hypothetical protein